MPDWENSQEKKNLERNIDLVCKMFNKTLSAEERADLLEKHRLRFEKQKNFNRENTQVKRREKAGEKIKKYTPGGYVPSEFARFVDYYGKPEDTAEADKANLALAGQLGRDDEIGQAARNTLLAQYLNSVFDIDPDKLDLTKHPEEEVIDYAMSIKDKGAALWTVKLVLADSPMEFYEPEAVKALYRYAENLGGFVKSVVEFVESTSYVEYPLEILSDDDNMTFSQASGQDDVRPKDSDDPETKAWKQSLVDTIKFGYPYRNEYSTSSLEEKKERIEAFRKDYLSKHGKVTVSDFRQRTDKPPAYIGGYDKRAAAMNEMAQRLKSRLEGRTDAYAKALVSASQGWTETLGGTDPLAEIPGETEAQKEKRTDEAVKKLVKATESMARAIHTYRNAKDIDKTTPEEQELDRLLVETNKLVQGINGSKAVDRFKAMIEFARIDRAAAQKADEHMEAERAELNRTLEAYKKRDNEGNLPHLDWEDIRDIGIKITSLKKNTLDYLNSLPETVEKLSAIELQEKELRKLDGMLKGINKALPGLTLDNVLNETPCLIDVTGRNIDLSKSAEPMYLNAPDGNLVSGVFSSSLEAGSAKDKLTAEINLLTERMKERYPELEEDIEQYAEFLKDDIGEEKGRIERKDSDRIEQANGLADTQEETRRREVRTAMMREFEDQVSLLNRAMSDTMSFARRRAAVSDVAGLLGLDSFTEKILPVNLVNREKITEGVFAYTGEGRSLNELTSQPEVFKKDIDGMFTPDALRQMADIGAMNYLCGIGIRGADGLRYTTDENGLINGVSSSGNDLAFCSGTVMNNPKDTLRVISRDMAQKIEALSENTLKTVILSQGGSEKQAEEAAQRLGRLQALISHNDLEILDDAGFAQKKLSDFLPQSDKNAQYYDNLSSTLFGQVIKSVGYRMTGNVQLNYQTLKEQINAQEEIKIIPPEKEDRAKVFNILDQFDKNSARQDIEPAGDLLTQMDNAQRGVFFGSDKFENVIKTLQTIKKASEMIAGDDRLANKRSYEVLETGYEKLREACKAYLDYKKEQGKLEAGGKTGRRIDAVKAVQEFCFNKQKALKEALHPEPVHEKRAEAEKMLADLFDQKPTRVGEEFRKIKESALNAEKLSITHTRAAAGVHILQNYMAERGKTPAECGLTEQDMKDMRLIQRMGKQAKLGSEKKVKDFLKETKKLQQPLKEAPALNGKI